MKMGTRVLTDIHNDIKQLITAITLYEENEEGFKVCEKFCLSNIKHHRFLSVNSNATKAAIKGVVTKLSIHGRYEAAKKLEQLFDTFLSSFDFEHHPQYDLQWYLLTLLLELSKETHKLDLESLKLTRGECTFNTTTGVKNDVTEEIDWAEYLQEGNEEFFCDYKSDTESEWSDDSDKEITNSGLSTDLSKYSSEAAKIVCLPHPACELDKLSQALGGESQSRSWLLANVQNSWWNELNWRTYPVKSKFCDAHLCEIWHRAKQDGSYSIGTLSEYQVCREIMWMFHVQTQMAVFQRNSEGNFSIRPHVSIPSLTPVAFDSVLKPFCELFLMIHKLEQFGNELYPLRATAKKPPLTYEAYNAALKHHLNKLKYEMVAIEKTIMKQDNIHTLLFLATELKKHINVVKILYEIHEQAIIDWKNCANWICAARLLSTIYCEMQKSQSRERANVCATLYLSTLTVYLNIIDTWLSDGRLEDWRNEFVIVRISDKQLSNNTEQYEAFTVRCLDDIPEKDPILEFLIKKVQHMGQSIELLVSLDRISDIWKVNVTESGIKNSLVNELLEKFEAEISKYSISDECTIVDKCHSEIDGRIQSFHDIDIEENIIGQLSENSNPFLMKAMEEHIPSNLFDKDATDACPADPSNSKMLTCNIFEKLENVQYILPLRKILQASLSDILMSRYNSASKLVKDIMIKEYKLDVHLTLMRSVFMMETGHIMNKFYHILFQEIESNQMWCNSYFLSCILEEVLSHYWPDFSSRWSVTVQDTLTNQVLLAVDNITLHYAAGWPVNIMLNEKTFTRYNEIFRFQLKLKWALWTLNNLRFSDLEGSKSENKKSKLEYFQIRRLENLRFWLLHALGSIHAYLSGQVLQSLGLVLEKAMKQAESLDKMISVHDEYLRKVHEHCLLTSEFEDLMATINNLIDMCTEVRKWWTNKKVVLAIDELDALQNNYVKYHTYLALALHNAVQNKDANYYELVLDRSQEERDRDEQDNDPMYYLNNYGSSLLMEIAYQYLPPSGLPVSIPHTIYVQDWRRQNFDFETLPTEVTIHGYEQTFSYLRWYYHEETFLLFNTSSQSLLQEIRSFLDSQILELNF